MLLGRFAETKMTPVAFTLATLVLGCFGNGGGPGPGPQPGGAPPTAVCGDGICSATETTTSCPADCARPPRCGDGICAAGETCASCPDDCAAACASACGATDLGPGPSASVSGSTSDAPSEVDAASCGDGTAGTIQRYRFTALAAGRYRVSVSGTFETVVDARSQSCGGEELGCEVATSGTSATFEVDLGDGQQIILEVGGLGGSAGDFNLDVTLEPAVCGNQLCEFGETCASCPTDCGTCGPTCGDGVCDVGESCASCPTDCGTCGPVCGDGVCELGENCASCPTDCGTCGPVCGDGTCDFGEDCASCPTDCGTCGTTCGDGTCDFGEDCASCPADCGTCGPVCGDGTCDGGEDCGSCPEDCGSCGTDP